MSAVLGGMRAPGDGATAGVRIFADTPDQVQLTVSADGYQIRRGSGQSQPVSEGELHSATSHRVQLSTRADAVTVTIDGKQVAQIPSVPTAAGGIELTAQREKPTAPLLQVSDLTVAGA